MTRSNFKNTITQVNRYIGMRFDDPQLQEELKFEADHSRIVATEDGYVGFKVNHAGEQCVFSAVQVAAMLINALVESVSDTAVQSGDVVVSVPAWYTDAQRRAMKAACEVASVRCLQLVNTSTAAALNYGIWKSARNEFKAEEKTHVMFLDMGYASFEAVICSFVTGKLEVVARAYDKNVGGRNIDNAIIDKFAEQFMAKHTDDPRTNPKALIKLKEACEKAKVVLTPEGVPSANINVEFLMNEKDLLGKLSRDDYEELLKAPVQVRAAGEGGGEGGGDIMFTTVVGVLQWRVL